MEIKTFEEILNEHGSLLYTNVGVSMLPLIREGKDIIYIEKRPAERLKKYDVALFVRPNVIGRGRYVLHRVLRVNPDGTYWIVGDNCVSGEIVKEENVIGVLASVRRKAKLISMSDKNYLWYVRLWCAPYRLRFFVLKAKQYMRRIYGKMRRLLRLKK